MTNITKKVVKRTKKPIKYPTRWITHTISNTMITIDTPPDNELLKDEFVIGEFCRYINCTFIITLAGDKGIHFDECDFNDCTFYFVDTPQKGKLDLSFVSCDINNLYFRQGANYNNIAFYFCTIKRIKLNKHNYLIAENLSFTHCYTVTDVDLKLTVLFGINLIDNSNYDNVELPKTVIGKINIKDKHLLKYWTGKDKIKLNDNQDIIYTKIGDYSDGKKKK